MTTNETTPSIYEAFRHTNGRLYAYVAIPIEDFFSTLVPVEAKWGLTDCEYDDEGNLVSYTQRTLADFAPWYIEDEADGVVYVMLCACVAPAYRQKSISEDDLNDWQFFLELIFGLTLEDWMTYEEMLAEIPSETV